MCASFEEIECTSGSDEMDQLRQVSPWRRNPPYIHQKLHPNPSTLLPCSLDRQTLEAKAPTGSPLSHHPLSRMSNHHPHSLEYPLNPPQPLSCGLVLLLFLLLDVTSCKLGGHRPWWERQRQADLSNPIRVCQQPNESQIGSPICRVGWPSPITRSAEKPDPNHELWEPTINCTGNKIVCLSVCLFGLVWWACR